MLRRMPNLGGKMSDAAVHRIASVFHPTDFSKASTVAFEQLREVR
jgi:hypothetical protein